MSRNRNSRLVYSTDPDLPLKEEQPEEKFVEPGAQNLRIWRERRGGGKIVTIVKGFQGPEAELMDLGKRLKRHCGAGGTVKDGQILIQGDVRDKVLTQLLSWGYGAKKSGG